LTTPTPTTTRTRSRSSSRPRRRISPRLKIHWDNLNIRKPQLLSGSQDHRRNKSLDIFHQLDYLIEGEHLALVYYDPLGEPLWDRGSDGGALLSSCLSAVAGPGRDGGRC
jgi:hypothetical protein